MNEIKVCPQCGDTGLIPTYIELKRYYLNCKCGWKSDIFDDHDQPLDMREFNEKRKDWQ